MKDFNTLFVGDDQADVFADTVAALQAKGGLRCVPRISEALQVCATSAPRLLVLSQVRPGMFEAADVEALHAAAPLARMVTFLGPWCEGETRTGHPWAGVSRLYWHQLSERVIDELLHPYRSKWELPRTSSDVERFLKEADAPALGPGLVVVRSEDELSYRAISEGLAVVGASSFRVRGARAFSVVGARAGIWDCARGVAEDREALAAFVERLHPCPVVALVGFIRPEDRRLAQRCGVHSAWGKPLLLEDLWGGLQSALSPAASPAQPFRVTA